VFCGSSTSGVSTGLTLTPDFGSATGVNHITLDTTSYSTGQQCTFRVTSGTVSGASVVGAVVGGFSLGYVSALRPTTAGRTLDVSATGGAGLDWSNVESQTSTVGLTNTTIGTVTTVSSVTGETTIVSPIGTGGLLTLVRADDYYVADGTQLTFTRDTWPNLTGATSVTMTVRARSDDSVIFAVTDKVASRVTGAGDQTVVFELGTADTALLTPGRLTGKYDIRAVLSNGHIVTLEVTDPPNSYGGVTVLENQTR
jgi:hypothetical protein